MSALELSLLVWTGSLSAGFFGSLTGLGGGVVIVPLLTLLLGVDIRYAIGASLISVIVFALQRDGIYVAVTLPVLAILLRGLAKAVP
jgi:uncharacterized membrane protein YfcA